MIAKREMTRGNDRFRFSRTRRHRIQNPKGSISPLGEGIFAIHDYRSVTIYGTGEKPTKVWVGHDVGGKFWAEPEEVRVEANETTFHIALREDARCGLEAIVEATGTKLPMDRPVKVGPVWAEIIGMSEDFEEDSIHVRIWSPKHNRDVTVSLNFEDSTVCRTKTVLIGNEMIKVDAMIGECRAIEVFVATKQVAR